MIIIRASADILEIICLYMPLVKIPIMMLGQFIVPYKHLVFQIYTYKLNLFLGRNEDFESLWNKDSFHSSLKGCENASLHFALLNSRALEKELALLTLSTSVTGLATVSYEAAKQSTKDSKD